MNLQTGEQGADGIIWLVGNIGFDHRARLYKMFCKWLEQVSATEVVVDCAGVTGLDSAGLALLLLMRDRAHAKGCRFCVRGCSRSTHWLFGDARFRQMFCVLS